MQNLHVIHDDIALHKSPPVAYIHSQEDGTRSAQVDRGRQRQGQPLPLKKWKRPAD
jgi:hypothetical protein